jgi:hypothetical protein
LVSINAYVDFDSIYNFHNQERAKNSLKSLSVNPLLIESATAKAEAMLKSDCWSHYCPDGKSPWDFFDSAGYEYVYAGENLGEGFSENETLMSAWMNSPTHRENIMNSNFSEIGIGFAKGDYQGIKNNTIVVVHFGTSVSGSVIANTNEVVQKPESESVVDQTPPAVNFDDFSIDQVTINGIDQYSIIFRNQDVSNFEVVDGFTSKKIGTNSWEISVPKNNSESVFSIVTKSSDALGNETKYELPFKQLLQKLVLVDVYDKNVDTNIFTSIYKGISQNPKTQLNISVMIFLTGLFGIDYYMLEKSGQTNAHHSNRHLILILIIISLVLLIVTSASGQILEGVTF